MLEQVSEFIWSSLRLKDVTLYVCTSFGSFVLLRMDPTVGSTATLNNADTNYKVHKKNLLELLSPIPSIYT